MSPSALPNGHAHTNGHSTTSATASASSSHPSRPFKPLEPSSALSALDDYPQGDGLSVTELMDSRRNGGLTYNDFLMLPGHIDFSAGEVSLQTRWATLILILDCGPL